MTRTSLTTRRALPVIASVGLLAVLLSSPAAVAADEPGPTAADERAEASLALDTAQDVLDGAPGAPTRDATLALRDVAVSYDALSRADRAQARELLASPSTAAKKCVGDVCVNYETTGAGASTPAYVDSVLATVQNVRGRYRAAGYRDPKPDPTAGSDQRFQVYLSDIGADRLYGYCTTDSGVPSDGPYDVDAYCVLDNDFKASQFPAKTPLQNLQVTAAHEYFHAVQFAYDVTEDRWLLEATATWAEDEVYDDVNDNLQYLAKSPLTTPSTPLDTFSNSTGFHYGTWVFFRYLTERFPAAQGGMPVLVRKIFERADGAAGGPDDYSLEAVRSALTAQTGLALPLVFAQFADANLRPKAAYSEATTNKYPSAKLKSTKTLSSSTRSSGTVKVTMNHLTSSTARFKPSKTTSKWRLQLGVNMDQQKPGATALVTSVSTTGVATTTSIPLNQYANGSTTIGFAASKVSYVDLTIVNFGGRYTCWRGTDFSCGGASLDDRTAQSYSVKALPN